MAHVGSDLDLERCCRNATTSVQLPALRGAGMRGWATCSFLQQTRRSELSSTGDLESLCSVSAACVI